MSICLEALYFVFFFLVILTAICRQPPVQYLYALVIQHLLRCTYTLSNFHKQYQQKISCLLSFFSNLRNVLHHMFDMHCIFCILIVVMNISVAKKIILFLWRAKFGQFSSKNQESSADAHQPFKKHLHASCTVHLNANSNIVQYFITSDICILFLSFLPLCRREFFYPPFIFQIKNPPTQDQYFAY